MNWICYVAVWYNRLHYNIYVQCYRFISMNEQLWLVRNKGSTWLHAMKEVPNAGYQKDSKVHTSLTHYEISALIHSSSTLGSVTIFVRYLILVHDWYYVFTDVIDVMHLIL